MCNKKLQRNISNTYVTGKIIGYIRSLYQGESAGSPNIPVTVIRNIKSKADNAIKSVRNVSVNVEWCRFRFKTTTLKIFAITPKHETEN